MVVGCEGGGGGSDCDPVDDAGNPSQCWARAERQKVVEAYGMTQSHAVMTACNKPSVIYLSHPECSADVDWYWSDYADESTCVIVPDPCKPGVCMTSDFHIKHLQCSTNSDCPPGQACTPLKDI